MAHDELGIRMKERYEDRAKTYLPRRTYTIIRIDGKAFHTALREAERPYDIGVMEMMNQTTLHLCKNIQGAIFAYTQSDEISILLTDFADIKTDAWFDGSVQKICSISASLATFSANDWREAACPNIDGPLLFDSRCFVISDPVEVFNYFVWRQQDATRNAINMVGQSMYSHKELHNKNVNEVQEMIFQKGKNFNDYPAGFKRGRVIVKRMGPQTIPSLTSPEGSVTIEVNKWVREEPPIFTQDRAYLKSLIPVHPDFVYKSTAEEVLNAGNPRTT